MSDPATAPSSRRLHVFLLKFFDAERWRVESSEPEGWILPYALDTLRSDGVELAWSDAAHRAPWTRRGIRGLVRWLERLTAPFLHVLVSTREIARADVVLTVFESQANALALLRSLRIPPYRRPRLAVVSCWLADQAPRFSRPRRALYRFSYRSVDRIIYFSENQTPIYHEVLGVPEERLTYVPFGVDHHYFSPQRVPEEPYVLAVGRDRGRDWATLFDAVKSTGLTVKVACRPGELGDVPVPPNVEIIGTVDRDTYRDLTARATVIVVPTEVRAYPTGQSVVLEAMAMAKCCVVTDTPAMRNYVLDDSTALLVPPHDAAALTAAVQRAFGDASLRQRIGTAARTSVEQRHNAPAMWKRVAEVLEIGDR